MSTLVLYGSSRLVNHTKCYGIVIHSSDIQLDSFIKCDIYYIRFGYYLGWEVVYKRKIERKDVKMKQLSDSSTDVK